MNAAQFVVLIYSDVLNSEDTWQSLDANWELLEFTWES
jgi:hypothetical protein